MTQNTFSVDVFPLLLTATDLKQSLWRGEFIWSTAADRAHGLEKL